MDCKEIVELAIKYQESDPNVAIVLFALAASKQLNLDYNFATYCQEFSKQVLYQMDVGNL
jgi:hypothetical protein